MTAPSTNILSLQVSEFAVAVQQASSPALRDRPAVVVSSRRSLGRVTAASPEAIESGITPGMRYPRAQLLCPDAAYLLPDPDQEQRAESAILKACLTLTPSLERAGPGRIFVDLSGTTRLQGPPLDQADQLRRSLGRELSLTPAMGLSRRKVWSSLAGRAAMPTGIMEVKPEREEDFLSLIPPAWVNGIGPKTIERLADMNIDNLHQLCQFSPCELVEAFGRQGLILAEALRADTTAERILPTSGIHALLPNGNDVVEAIRPLKTETCSRQALHACLHSLTAECGLLLRTRHREAGRLLLTLSYSDGRAGSAAHKVTPATALDSQLLTAGLTTLSRALTRRVRVCRITLRCDCLSEPTGQTRLISMPEDGRERARLGALDTIRNRYGTAAIATGCELAEQLKADAP